MLFSIGAGWVHLFMVGLTFSPTHVIYAHLDFLPFLQTNSKAKQDLALPRSKVHLRSYWCGI